MISDTFQIAEWHKKIYDGESMKVRDVCRTLMGQMCWHIYTGYRIFERVPM